MRNVIPRELQTPLQHTFLSTSPEANHELQRSDDNAKWERGDPPVPGERISSAVRYCLLEETTVTGLDRYPYSTHRDNTDANLQVELREAKAIFQKLRADFAREQRRALSVQTEAANHVAQVFARLQVTEEALTQERGRNQGLREEL